MDKMKEFGSWKEVIIDFFENQIEKITSKGPVCKLYKARDYIGKKENEIKKEKSQQKIVTLELKINDKLAELKKLRKEAPSAEIRDWLEINAKKSGSIMKATHVLKFSHSSSAPEGIYLEDKSTDTVLSTSSFKKTTIPDLAHSNGALISISRFLHLEFKSKRIFDLLLADNYDFLKGFYANDKQLSDWKNGFSKLVQKIRKIQTTDKAKQIYFILDDTKKYNFLKDIPYHLIIPLFPSSLSEEIYQHINMVKYGEEQKEIKKQKRPEAEDKEVAPKFHPSPLISLPNIGIQNYGGEYPRNVSMLNADRQGKACLFSTQPPTWENQLKPSVYKESLFDHLSTYQINEDIKYLVEFLQRFKQLDLSYKDPKRYAHLERWVESIVDEVLYYANTIQKLPASWSEDENIRLKIEHQYFLDPYRDDKAFQAKRSATDWQTIVLEDFANWMNRQLVQKDKQFAPQAEHTQLWKKLFKDLLREDTETIKAEKQFNKQRMAV